MGDGEITVVVGVPFTVTAVVIDCEATSGAPARSSRAAAFAGLLLTLIPNMLAWVRMDEELLQTGSVRMILYEQRACLSILCLLFRRGHTTVRGSEKKSHAASQVAVK